MSHSAAPVTVIKVLLRLTLTCMIYFNLLKVVMMMIIMIIMTISLSLVLFFDMETSTIRANLDCKTVRIFAYSSTREQSNKRSGKTLTPHFTFFF